MGSKAIKPGIGKDFPAEKDSSDVELDTNAILSIISRIRASTGNVERRLKRRRAFGCMNSIRSLFKTLS